MIGAPLHTGTVSEVVPVAPRADVRAPLVMERLLQHQRAQADRDDAAQLGELARSLGGDWQRLISSNFEGYDAQYVLERFVGVTLRDLCAALRTSGRVLPLDVARAISSVILDGLVALEAHRPPADRPIHLTDRSIGLGLDRRWRFAIGALNHWLADHRPLTLGDPAVDGQPLSPDVMFFLSPEAFQGRDETPAGVATRAALFLWQLVTGHHPFRGTRYKLFESITRFSRGEVRVPITIHPQVGPALAEVMIKGVRYAGERFGDLAELRAALDAAWPVPAASSELVFQTVVSVCWTTMKDQLQSLRREPLLPIKWDGVWSASRTPEEALAVLEDQLLELQLPLDGLPRRHALPPDAEDAPFAPQARAPPSPPPGRVTVERLTLNLQPGTERPTQDRPRGFLSRLFATLLGR